MKDNNTMGRLEYILENTFWVCMAAVWYYALFFVPLKGKTHSFSFTVLVMLAAALVFFGVIITFNNRRNNLSLAVNVLLPFQLYTIAAYSDTFGALINVLLICALLTSAIFFTFVVFRRIRSKELSRFYVVRKRLCHAMLGSRTISVILLCTLFIPLSVNTIANTYFHKSIDSGLDFQEKMGVWTINNNIETVLKLKPEVWETLGTDEKLEVLDTVKNIESRYLGLNNSIKVVSVDLAENVLGSFDNAKYRISIDSALLENGSAEKVLHTLLHECHHAYGMQQVEVYNTISEEYKNMPMFKNAKYYSEEYNGYINGEENYIGYSSQYCEIHADAYADNALESYYEAIWEYENMNTDTQSAAA